MVVKLSDKVEGSGENIDAPLCGELYKEEDNYLVHWSGTDPYANINCFTWHEEENNLIVTYDQYNEEFKNWQGNIHNGQFRLQTLKEKRNTEEKCNKYSGYAKFNGIPRKGNPEIPIKSYNDQCI